MRRRFVAVFEFEEAPMAYDDQDFKRDMQSDMDLLLNDYAGVIAKVEQIPPNETHD